MIKRKLTALLMAAAITLTAAACGTPAPADNSTAVPSQSASVPPATPSSISTPAPSSVLPESGQPQCVLPAQRVTIKIAALKGPSAIGMMPMIEQAGNPETSKNSVNDYKFTIVGAPDQLAGGVIKGEYDIAVLPTNMASVVYNKTEGKIKLATINTLGVLYLVEAGDTIKTMADLKGKTIYSSGKGATPEYVLNYLLTKNGLKVGEDVKVEYKGEHSEITALMASGEAEIALLPQPFVETAMAKNKNLRIALDCTKEWQSASKDGSGLAMSGIVVQKKFLEENPEAVAAFLAEYEAATKYITDPANIDAAAQLAVKQEIIPNAEIAKKAIPQCNITYIAGKDMKTTAGGFLKILFDADPKAVGGKLPDEGFYYIP